jgi:quinol monooxygenase YgiN
MIVATIRVRITGENRKELMQTFHSLSEPIQSESGCRSCRVYREVGNGEAVIVIEEWETRKHWNNHLCSDGFAVMIGAMSLLKESESVEFQLLDQLLGSESIEAIRARDFSNEGERL